MKIFRQPILAKCCNESWINLFADSFADHCMWCLLWWFSASNKSIRFPRSNSQKDSLSFSNMLWWEIRRKIHGETVLFCTSWIHFWVPEQQNVWKMTYSVSHVLNVLFYRFGPHGFALKELEKIVHNSVTLQYMGRANSKKFFNGLWTQKELKLNRNM